MFKFVRWALLSFGLVMSVSAFGTTYYVAANGLDANNGTSKTSPWLHAPGMTGCTGICASTNPQPGDSIILHGGDAWHWTGSGITPVGLPWTWTWSGSSGNPIYVGVDTTWYNSSVCGSSFCRPKFNGDNPLSTSNVTSCPYPTNGTNNELIYQKGQSYTTWDNFEMLGACLQGTGNGEYVHHYGCYDTYKNFFIHGWTLAPDATYGVTWGDQLYGFAGTTSGSCPDGKTYPFTGNQFSYNIFDGSDSSPQGLMAHRYDCYSVDHSYMTQFAGNNCNNMHLVHDTVVEYAAEDGSVALSTSDSPDHGDTWQFYGEANSNNYFYNNVVRHAGVYLNGGGGTPGIGINVIFEPTAGYTDTVFNNVIYDVTSGNFLTVSPSGSGGSVQLINNTFQMYASQSSIKCVGAGACSLSQNNHFISDSSQYTTGATYNGPTTTVTDLLETTSAATTAGYTSSNQYMPSSGTSPTVGAGTSWSSTCAALTDAGAAAACASATTLACTYALGSGVLSCPAQQTVARSNPPDIGAYAYSGLPAPTGLSATAH